MAGRLEETMQGLRREGRKGLIIYLMAGDPDLAFTEELVTAIVAAGADVIELGVPFSDPMADGPVIQRAAVRALQSGTTLPKILSLVAALRPKVDVPLVLMTYLNPVWRFGLQEFASRAAQSGVDGVIIPDLPLEEALNLAPMFSDHGMAYVPLVAPTTTPERIQTIARLARGFIYCVSVTGVTGVRQEVASGLADFMGLVRQHAPGVPLAIGFGVSGPKQAKELAAYGDGVIVGSAVMKLIDERAARNMAVKDVASFVRGLKTALQ